MIANTIKDHHDNYHDDNSHPDQDKANDSDHSNLYGRHREVCTSPFARDASMIIILMIILLFMIMIRGCPHITSAAGGEGGGRPNADDC